MRTLFEIVEVIGLPGRGLLLTGLGPKGKTLKPVEGPVVVRWLDGVETEVKLISYNETFEVPDATLFEVLVPEHAGISHRARGGTVLAK